MQCAETETLRIPKVISVGDYSGGSFLVTEYLNFGGRADPAELGKALAHMHLATPKVRQPILHLALTDRATNRERRLGYMAAAVPVWMEQIS